MSFLGTDDMSDAGKTTIDVFAILGMIGLACVVSNTIINIVKLIVYYGISKLCQINLKKKYGGWAVVTGSTDGIGKAYAHELAKRGFNIVLISRTMQKLEKVAQELSDAHKVQTEIIQADFTNGRQIFEPIAQSLASKDIGILVNNVGVLAIPKKFEEITEDEIWNQVIVNVASVPAMCKLVLPGMLARKRALIVNVSSGAAIAAFPYFQVYAATKAFVRNFSVALEFEYRGTGLDIQTVLPGAVNTNMTAWSDTMNKPGISVPTPTKFASSAVSTIGYATETAGYWNHEMQMMMGKALPEEVVMLSAKFLTK